MSSWNFSIMASNISNDSRLYSTSGSRCAYPRRSDPFFQVVHVQQVILPQPVDHAQHHHPLVVAHGRRAQNLLLGLVSLGELAENLFAQLVPRQFLRLDSRSREIESEVVDELLRERLEIPLILPAPLIAALIQQTAQNSADVILQNQLALLDAFQQLPPQAVHRLALLVHHVVVLEQMFARLEVLRLNRLLRALDALRNHLRLNGHALFHAQPLQQRAHPLLGEDAHQVVFERQIKTRSRRDRPGVPRARATGCRCAATRAAPCPE